MASPEPVGTTGLIFVEAVAPFPLVSAGRSKFTVTLDSFESLEKASWSDFLSIVLIDPPPLPPRTWEMLHQWVSKGGGLVVWLGPSAGKPIEFSSAESESVLGGRIKRVWRSPRPFELLCSFLARSSCSIGLSSRWGFGAMAGFSGLSSLGVSANF